MHKHFFMYLYIHFPLFNVFFNVILLNGKRPVLVCKMTMSRNVTFHKRYAYMSLKYTLTGHFIGYTLLVLGWTHFCLQNCLILGGIDSTSVWKHSSEILVHIDMIVSHSCCRFVGCTSMMWISRSTTSQRSSIDGDLVTVEVIWVKWTHCHVQETSLRWLLCDMVHYPAGSSIRRSYTVVIKGWTWSATILR